MKKPALLNYFLFALLLLFSFSIKAQSCNCKYTVPLSQEIVDGSKLNVGPGDTVCIQAGVRTSLWFENFVGTPDKPIIFKNCGGQVIISNTTKWGISFSYSKYFKLLGNGSSNYKYGIKVNGVATVGLSFNRLSTDFEAAFIEVTKSGGPGCMAKTDPECDKPETWRGNFVMRNVSLHNFYIHDVGSVGGGGEGFYLGHSFFLGIERPCGTLYPHLIENFKVYDNIIENTVFDGMQVSCAVKDVYVYNNSIRNYGTINNGGQQTGLVVGGGTKNAKVFNNRIDKGTGPGVCVFGQGNIYFYNNAISNTGLEGVFIDDRGTDPTLGLYFYNNTVVNSKLTGMLTYNAIAKINVFYNNLIVNPNNWSAWGSNWKKAFIYLENSPTINKVVKYDTANNYFLKDMAAAQFIDLAGANLHLKSTSPAIDRGKDLTALGITSDADNLKRPYGKAFDIGAYEYGSTTSSSPAVATLSVTTTSSSALCNGSATGKASAYVSGGTSPYTYLWSNGKTSQTIDLLKAGSYSVTVTDSRGVKASSTVSVNQPSAISITSTKVDLSSTTKGSINVTVSGGISPYTFSWSNGSTTEDLTNLLAGTYTLTVKDKNACVKTASITINNTIPAGFNGVYNIISKRTGKYLEILNNSTAENAYADIRTFNNSVNQQWKVQLLSDGYYRIINANSGKSLDVTGTIDGSNVLQRTMSTSDCQKFRIEDVGSGYFKIIPKCGGRGFQVKDNATVDGSLVVLWTYWGGDFQKWQLKLVSNTLRLNDDSAKIISEEPVKLYPNPVNGDVLNVVFDSENDEEATVTILNSMNKQELTLTHKLVKGENQFEIPTTHLQGGIHFVVLTKSNYRVVKKILVAK